METGKRRDDTTNVRCCKLRSNGYNRFGVLDAVLSKIRICSIRDIFTLCNVYQPEALARSAGGGG
jgi:hypothetical protein